MRIKLYISLDMWDEIDFAQHEPRRISVSVPADVVERWQEDNMLPPDFIEQQLRKVMDDPTTRLPSKCQRCHDTLPVGATFCIECGEKV